MAAADNSRGSQDNISTRWIFQRGLSKCQESVGASRADSEVGPGTVGKNRTRAEQLQGLLPAV